MKFISVCSGIEAASQAWGPLGWTAIAFSEIEAFPCDVLAAHYPDVPNWGDMTKYEEWPDANIDVLCGGTPCQSFSVAGLREGLSDPRGNLMLTFGAIAAKYRPRWLVWENVPGVLSSAEGRDFAAFLGLLTGQRVEPPAKGWGNSGILAGIDSAYGVAWRILDAQYAGVPQRRRRVFVVGYLGDWHRAAAVLFERHSLSGDTAPSRKTREDVAGTLSARTQGGGGLGTDFELAGGVTTGAVATLDASFGRLQGASGQDAGHGHSHLIPLAALPFDTTQITNKANRSSPKAGDPCHPLAAGAHAPAIAFHGSQDPSVSGDVTNALGTNHGLEACIAFQERGHPDGGRRLDVGGDVAYALLSGDGDGGRAHGRNVLTPTMQVRRLTPLECERLMGCASTIELLRIDVCCDHQTAAATVALSCLKWQSNASRADAKRYPPSAVTAGPGSSASLAAQESPVALHVSLRSDSEVALTSSPGRSCLPATGARGKNSFHMELPGSSVRSLVPTLRELANLVKSGKAESLLSMRLSTPAVNGESSAQPSGEGIEASAGDAASAHSTGMFTTSELGQLTPTCGSKEATLCCSAIRAIAGCIPNETLPDSFSLELTLETPYTAITRKGKPAADGPRYKSLGNSWAIPDVTWIGQRIQQVEDITNGR